MNVERASRCCFKHCLRQNQSVGRDHQDIALAQAHSFKHGIGFKGWGLNDVQPPLQCPSLYGALRGMQAPARGTVGLRKNQSNLVTGPEQRRKRSLGEFRGPGEN
jgi:hypothetical protein